jgi:hypothetical protein
MHISLHNYIEMSTVSDSLIEKTKTKKRNAAGAVPPFHLAPLAVARSVSGRRPVASSTYAVSHHLGGRRRWI